MLTFDLGLKIRSISVQMRIYQDHLYKMGRGEDTNLTDRQTQNVCFLNCKMFDKLFSQFNPCSS